MLILLLLFSCRALPLICEIVSLKLSKCIWCGVGDAILKGFKRLQGTAIFSMLEGFPFFLNSRKILLAGQNVELWRMKQSWISIVEVYGPPAYFFTVTAECFRFSYHYHALFFPVITRTPAQFCPSAVSLYVLLSRLPTIPSGIVLWASLRSNGSYINIVESTISFLSERSLLEEKKEECVVYEYMQNKMQVFGFNHGSETFIGTFPFQAGRNLKDDFMYVSNKWITRILGCNKNNAVADLNGLSVLYCINYNMKSHKKE